MMVDVDTLRAVLTYEGETGKLYWTERPPSMFPNTWDAQRWNRRYAGKEAFTYKASDGYMRGAIFDRRMLAHRVVWAMHHGYWPADMIDHINGVKDDNRISNLREATRSENKRNSKAEGLFKGVRFEHKKWRARIFVNNKRVHLGLFESAEDAAKAYDAAALKHYGPFARLNFSS
jgi:hypothetical protein